jgi:hypothetical protein
MAATLQGQATMMNPGTLYAKVTRVCMMIAKPCGELSYFPMCNMRSTIVLRGYCGVLALYLELPLTNQDAHV